MQKLRQLIVTTCLRAGYAGSRVLGLKMRGIGFLLRRLRSSFIFEVEGRRFLFLPECAGAYCLLPAGLWNEPETHIFFGLILPAIGLPFIFVDVGASVGEMVIDVAGFPNATKILAFEPEGDCATAIRSCAALNGFKHLEVINKAVADRRGHASFAVDARSPTAAHLCDRLSSARQVETTTLDEIALPAGMELLLLIDVEGFEPAVMRGAQQTIQRHRPLIVFEYNDTSKRHFDLGEIRPLLGPGYDIYRLRSDGRLDKDCERAWNCVGIHRGSPWASPCAEMIVLD